MSLPPIAVFPSLYVQAWDGAGRGLEGAALVDWAAFTTPQDTDAMAVGYLVPGEDTFPRLRTDSPAHLHAAGGEEPLLYWAIYDVDTPGHTPWLDRERAAAALDAALFALGEEWGGYTTRAGLRLLVPLDPPCPVTQGNDLLRLVAEGLVNPVLDLLGLAVDPASYEWTRLMRLPRAKRDGQVLDPVTVEPLGSLPWRALGYQPQEQRVEAAEDHGDAPPEPLLLTYEDWAHARTYPGLRRGEPIPSEAGHTYPVLRRWLAKLAAAGHIHDPHVLVSYVWASVLATPGLTLAEAWKLACWVADRQAASDAAPAPDPNALPEAQPLDPEEWLSVRAAFKGRDAAYFDKLRDGRVLSTVPSRQEDATWHVMRLLVDRARLSPQDVYRAVHGSVVAQRRPTLPQVWERALAMAATTLPEDSNEAIREVFVADHPLTIRVLSGTGSLYQLDTSVVPYSYRRSDTQSLALHFEKYTRPNLPFEADYYDPQRGLRPLPELLLRYGATAASVDYVSGGVGVTYDPEGEGRLTQGVHQIAAKRSVYDAEVDKWLRLVGGSDPEGFLDWLASVTYTAHEPLCALYLQGPPGTGKSLLISGIASLWGSSAVAYHDVGGTGFNSDMLNCPLVAADEGIALPKYDEAVASEVFRNLVANKTHSVNAKYRATERLYGAMRVLVTANDDEGIPFRKALGQDGLDAIVQRIMYIEQTTAPGEYLRALGGRAGVVDWVRPGNQPGRLAEHLLWLRDNRKVQRGSRFLVEGRLTDWHRNFVVQQGLKPSLLLVAWGMYRAQRKGMPASGVELDREAQVLWVSNSAIREQWTRYADIGAPRQTTITKTLKMLAANAESQVRRVGGQQYRMWALPLAAFEDADIATVEEW